MIVQSPARALLAALLLAPLSALAATPAARFEVSRFQLEGAPLADPARLEALLSPYTGADRTIEDLHAARSTLEASLREDGHPFAVVQLPPQTVAGDGSVTLRVVEYTIGRITLEGAQFHDRDNVLRSLPALAEGTVPKLGALDAQLQVANDSPVKRTTVTMQPGLHDTIDFAVQVQDVRPWRFATTLDNTGTDETGALRFGLGFQHANLWNRDHVFSVQYVTAPHDDGNPDHLAFPIEDDVQIVGASYRIPVPQARGALELYGGSANVDSGVVAGVFDITGSGTVLGTRFILNLPTHAAWTQRLTAGYETRDYDNDVQLAGGSGQLVPDYRVNPFSVGYTTEAQFSQFTMSAQLMLSHNLPSGSHSSAADFEAVRAGAEDNYTLFRLGGGAQMGLGGAGEVGFRLDGQYTSDLLVPGEQFGIGGMNSVRGLEERQFIADRGLSTSLEWISPDLFSNAPRFTTRALLFFDAAWGETIRPTAFEQGSIDVQSVGAGLRLGNERSLNFRIDYGHLIDPPPGISSGRWHGGFSWFF